jgi:phosphoglycolate phosphatase-like HAD superfamily hydrolase
MKISNYATITFDCDGVLLNSNKVKTEAFYDSVISYGEEFAGQLVVYHKNNGGISRYKKFDYFLKEIVGLKSYEQEMEVLLKKYSELVRKGLLECDIAMGLSELKSISKNATWLVASGGDQGELRELFESRSISNFFDGGIFGSPDTKDIILSREISSENIKQPALFVGDSEYDYISAKKQGIDFIFVSGWTEMVNWKSFCFENQIKSIKQLRELL